MANKKVFVFSVLLVLVLGASLFALTERGEKVIKTAVEQTTKVTAEKTKSEPEQDEPYTIDENRKKKYKIYYYNGVQLNDEDGNYIGPNDPVYYREANIHLMNVEQYGKQGAGFLKSLEFKDGEWELTFIVKDRKEKKVRYQKVFFENWT